MKWAGHKPIKCFWVPLSGHVRAHITYKHGGEQQKDFPSEAEAKAFVEVEWAECGNAIKSSSRQMLLLYEGRQVTDKELPPGAMWDAFWMREMYPMPDGICLMVKLPNGGSWCVDSRASNCDRPYPEPEGKDHRCWIRTGDPRTGAVHVTKGKPGESCNAGAGSIGWGKSDSPDYYHGFLHNGFLVPA